MWLADGQLDGNFQAYLLSTRGAKHKKYSRLVWHLYSRQSAVTENYIKDTLM